MNYLRTANNDFENFFDDMFNSWGIRNSQIPTVDVWEDDKNFYVEADLAGYSDSEVNVHVEKHVLHISSEKVNAKDNRKYLIREKNYVKFDRSFSLPEGINEDAISAVSKNGILTITLPKMPVEQPKKISVKIQND